MGNISEPVVSEKIATRRLEKVARDAQVRAFLADIALLEVRTKLFGDGMEKSKSNTELAEVTIDAFEKALRAFEAGIDLFNARMENFQDLEPAV
ncbi:hypothetical protein NW768_004832 [Fusarium equiseti]|uniref:Uncharacterized protein n=1 Tax=Fusarium equiseti TaxID=61235 RepID=A0ABQ8RHE3_FUSEQ|nr:hypothetical protein NW768_004832 [Fusarium equiseti]